ncbi:DUF3307 domain-containing protein [Pannonibacter carbonis]|uniref:DUF3307 domain-containing protein n=1 Tax=Pannonibacter carbonis TaxID=2067569 RepID=UPI0018E587B8|nr:DUF3307 domain-containing protein [Pannonibacter carbonis]
MAIPDQVPVGLLSALFLAFLAKHFLADFLLQTYWMAAGKEKARHWLVPLSVHAGIHAVLTGLVCLWFAPWLVWLALVDFAVHFCIDRGKAGAVRAIGATPARASFWWLLGLDQSLHHLTHFGFSLLLAGASTV